MGKGGTITLKAGGKTLAEGRLERSVPIQFSIGEGVDIGMDTGSAVDFTYKLPFAFTGRIEKVTVEVRPLAVPDDSRGARREGVARTPEPAE
jgi:arylsulfatase